MENVESKKISSAALFTFIAITLFYFFEFAQMSYFNVLAPFFLADGTYDQNQIASLSAYYYYGNVVGLLPVGFLLDRYPLRKVLLLAIIGSIISAFLVAVAHNYYIELTARFLCGFFGGTFSFLGGIKIIIRLFSRRFTLFISIFIAAGMLGALLCQYPLLSIAERTSTETVMLIMASFGLAVLICNIFCLHPEDKNQPHSPPAKYPGTPWQMTFEILKNYRNWCDCLLVVLLDTPTSIIGTLWGIVLLTSFYHFSASISAMIITMLFAGLIIGYPIFGLLSDKFNHKAEFVVGASLVSFLLTLSLVFIKNPSSLLVTAIFFGIGFLSSCQAIVFTWLTKNMRPELVGRNSAANSMIFMGTGGAFKQVGAFLLLLPSLIMGAAASANLLLLISFAMLIATIYACFRRRIFTFKPHEV
jgi:MFS family permease